MSDYLSDRELEELFKKVSESREFEYNPDAWNLIKPRLEKKKRRRRMLLWFLGIGVSALVLAGIVNKTYVNQTQTRSLETISVSSLEQEELNSPIKEAANNKTNNNSDKQSTLTSDHKQDNDNNKIIEDGSIPNTDSEFIKDAIAQPTNANSNRINNKYSDRIQKADGTTNRTSVVDQIGKLESSDDSFKNSVNPANAGNTINETGIVNSRQDVDKILMTSDEDNNRHLQINKAIITSLPTSPIQSMIIKQQHKDLPFGKSTLSEDNSTFKPFIGLELYVGQEWSTSNISYFRTGDTKVGFSLTYALSNKLAVTTGVGYRTDNYGAGKGLYKPPTGFWTDGIAPRYTSATCRILDIPLGLNYHFTGLTKSGFFSSVKVTSIFMLREYYRFSYDESNIPHVDNWSGRNANNHLFNDLHLSTGYQLRLNDNYMIKLAPYFQIPLKGIGHGNLKLYTIGAKFSVLFQTYR